MTTATDEVSTARKKPRYPERPLLSPESAQRIDRWADMLAPRLSGRRLARAELVNWLVMSRGEDLTEAELAALHDRHYDPVRALEWAVRAAKEAQARGEKVDVQEIVGLPNFRSQSPAPKGARRRKDPPTCVPEPAASESGEVACPSSEESCL